MSDRNVCPYCGREIIAGFVEFRGVQGYQGCCGGCGAKGPVIIEAMDCWQNEVVRAFTHPAYLLSKTGLIHLAPDEVVVKRATAEYLQEKLRTEPVEDENDMTDPSNIAFADLTAAIDAAKGE